MASIFRRRDMDVINGPVFGKIIVFAVPLILTNLLQILYSAADMIVVGRFSGVTGAVGAIGSTGPLINLVMNLIFGIAIGATVTVANHLGANNEKKTVAAVHSALQLGIVFGIVAMVVGVSFSRRLLVLMDADPALLDLSSLYTRIYFLGVPFSVVLNYCIAVLRAKGDTTTPFIVLSSSGVLNVVLNIVFVSGFGMNVDGVAIATSVSAAASMTAILIKMSRDRDLCRIEWKRLLHVDTEALRKIILIGLPAGVQGTLFALSNVFIQSAVNSFGPSVITANAICINIESIIFTATASIHQAALTFMGQNIGAGKYQRFNVIIRSCYAVTLMISVTMTVMIFCLRMPLVSLYVASDAEDLAAVLEAAMTRLTVVGLTYPLLAVMDTGSGLVRGMGKSFLSTTVSFTGSCLLRIVWIYTVFALFPGRLRVLYLAIPISWLITSVAQFICVMVLRSRLIRKMSAADTRPVTAETA